jgi:HEAT repeat protein
MSPSEQRVGVFTTDLELVVRSWDAWLAQATGVSAEAARGRPLADLLPELEPRGLLARFRRVLADGTVELLAPAFHHYLIRCAPTAPSQRFAVMQQWVTIAPLREEERIVGAIVTIEDVTERLDRERALAEQLSSPDEKTRLRAAQLLEAEAGAAHTLIGAVGDTSWRVRQSVVSGLARHGGADAISELLQALQREHQNPSVLNSALQVLALSDTDLIAPLVACLEAPDADLRIYAALLLGERHDPQAIPALVRALGDPDINVRYHAIEALGGLHASAAVSPLLDIAQSGEFFLAFPAIDALARIGDPRAVPALVPLLDNSLLRAPAVEALGELGDEHVVAPLVALLNQGDAPALAVAQALAALHERYERTYGQGLHIADLARQALRPAGAQQLLDAMQEASAEELRSLVLVLGWLELPVAQRSLTRLLGQQTVRSAVIEALVRHGAQVTELLVEQLDAEDLDTRQAALTALGRIGDPRAVPALISSLGDDTELATLAAGALGAIGDRRAFEALLGLAGHQSAPLRQAAVGALNSLGHPDLAARALAMCSDPDPHVRESAVRIAGYFGYPSCADALLERCADSDERVQRAAIEHLPYLDDPRVPATLGAMLRSPGVAARSSAARALGQLDHEQSGLLLLTALDDEDPWVRRFAARSLGQQRYAPAFERLADLVQADPAEHVRLAAIEALGHLGGPRGAAVLAPLTALANADVVREALSALGKISHPDALAPLEASAHAAAPSIRMESVRALQGRADDEAVRILWEVASADPEPDVAGAAVAALAAVGSEPAVAAMIALTADARSRAAAVAGLAQVSAALVEAVARGLESADPQVRKATVEALSRMGRPEASARLAQALDDGDPAVRLAAVGAFAHLGSRSVGRRLAAIAHADPDLAVRRAAHAALQR